MSRLTSEGTAIATEIAARYGVSVDAVETLMVAVANGQGQQAQFSHPDLGGMGQWSMGGMTMVGDMFNNGLKATVDGLCTEISGVLAQKRVFQPSPYAQPSGGMQSQSQGNGSSLFVPGGAGYGGTWWPEALGQASSTGTQNAMRYAIFPQSRRLAIGLGDRVEIYDTGDHQIGGVSQQQGGDQSLTFTSQLGLVRLSDLREVREASMVDHVQQAVEPPSQPVAEGAPEPEPETETSVNVPQASRSGSGHGDEIIALIRKLADLRDAGILTDAEFEAKKAELLARL
ncbi:SHOCT domain-containing protein [Primorskyibacter sp. 2E107]|uniref:SHOCT domain-containing protein n=1 Tax=Primorskyibacter sp. 2E107 TaxID=3403458 RepID=UPI003AF78874